MKITTSDKYTVKQILRWLWQAWRGNRLQATLNALLGVADVVLSLAQVWAVKHAIDVASGSDRGSIHWAVGIMGALILLNFAVNISGVWVRNLLGVRAQNRMQQATLRRILQSEWHSREHFHSGHPFQEIRKDIRYHGLSILTFSPKEMRKSQNSPHCIPIGRHMTSYNDIARLIQQRTQMLHVNFGQEIIQHIKIVLRFIIYKYTIKSLLYLNLKQLLTLL
jgi:ABC-type multidrug transport system fused ATPase/permease subunit